MRLLKNDKNIIMKLQLDTTERIIRVEETVNLGELFDLLEKLLPNEMWRAFKLETQTVISWVNPITIIEPSKYPDPYPWWRQPWFTYVGDPIQQPAIYGFNKGLFNIEV